MNKRSFTSLSKDVSKDISKELEECFKLSNFIRNPQIISFVDNDSLLIDIQKLTQLNAIQKDSYTIDLVDLKSAIECSPFLKGLFSKTSEHEYLSTPFAIYPTVLNISGFPLDTTVSQVSLFIAPLVEDSTETNSKELSVKQDQILNIISVSPGIFKVITSDVSVAVTLWRALDYCPYKGHFLQATSFAKPYNSSPIYNSST